MEITIHSLSEEIHSESLVAVEQTVYKILDAMMIMWC